jgi:hypothetical protein
MVEVVCRDEAEHRRRVESRTADLEAHTVPTWPEVEGREYEPWDGPRLTIDTSSATEAECLAQILIYLAA